MFYQYRYADEDAAEGAARDPGDVRMKIYNCRGGGDNAQVVNPFFGSPPSEEQGAAVIYRDFPFDKCEKSIKYR